MTSTHLDNLSPGDFLAMYERMVLIRCAEQRLAADFRAGKLPGPVHLSIGQEAVPVGVCAHLTAADKITSTHRGHGHFLAKGGDPESMFGEIYGRVGGVCGGLGGSMHVTDLDCGMLGANGIVGGGIGIAAGAALAAKLDEAGRVAVVFFGDGASTQGVLSETLNIASLWKLPLILCCENNGYSEFSPFHAVNAGPVFERAAPFGVEAAVVDGDDLVEVWRSVGQAVARARAGEGPTLLEARTYRYHGHVEGEAMFLREKYRTDEEVSARRERDPILRVRERLVAAEITDEEGLARIDEAIMERVSAAAEAAEAMPWPDPDVLTRFRMEAALGT